MFIPTISEVQGFAVTATVQEHLGHKIYKYQQLSTVHHMSVRITAANVSFWFLSVFLINNNQTHYNDQSSLGCQFV